MRQSFPAMRRAAVVCIAVLSVVGGAFLVWGLAAREQIALLTNAYLVGMVALFLLPGVALAAWELDRRASTRRPSEPDQDGPVHLHDAAQPREPQAGHRHRVRSGAEEWAGR